jgi:acyl-CoA reductase-like NAD-dependent aldehyde dehydrogenase
MSGVGRELGESALKNYLESKTVIVKMSNDTLP